MAGRATEFAGGEITDQTRQMVLDDLVSVEAGLISGETLEMPVYPVAGIELDYFLEQVRPGVAWNEKDLLDAAEHWGTARQFGTVPHVIRHRRNQLYKHVPDMIRADLSALVPEDDAQAERLQHWLSQVDVLTGPELANYLVYRELSRPTLSLADKKPRTPDDLTGEDPLDSASFRFGQDEYQEGWYDNPASFEIRTNQASLAVAALRKQRIVRTLHRYAKYYGFHLKIPNSHLNISYQTVEDGELKPTHELDTPEGQELVRRATDGQLEAAAIVMPSVGQIENRHLDFGIHAKYRAGPHRHAIRVLRDRFELRYGLGDQDFTEMSELALAAGFIAGMRGQSGESGFNTRTVERQWFVPGEKFDKRTDLHLLRALQEAEFDADGFAYLPEGYMFFRNSTREMLMNLSGVEEIENYAFNTFADLSKQFSGLIQTFRIDANGSLVCDTDKFSAWLLDAIESKNLHMQTLLGHTHGDLSADSITEKLGRFQPMTINTVSTAEQVITTDQLNWHELVRKFAGSRILQECISADTKGRLTAELTADFAEEDMLSAHFDKLLEDAVTIFNHMGPSSDEGPTDHDYERAVERIIDMSIGWFDKIIAGRPIDMALINSRMISAIRQKMIISKTEQNRIDMNEFHRVYVHEPRQRALIQMLEIIESRQAATSKA